ncbi:MAG TPA: CHAT domain-containing protein [Blastocatellia bacterium]|nr:CHAT domain-containing protein [Blastocatellia bacterium]
MEVEFVNRVHELNELCRTITLKTVIEAPAGFGKTYLLQEVKKRFLAEQPVGESIAKSRRGCALLDLQDYSGRNECLNLINEVARQIGGKKVKATELGRASEELAAHMGNYSSILLLIDSVERADDDTLEWLYRDLIEGELYNALHPRLKIVFAGRYLRNIRGNIDRLAKRYLPRWDGYNIVELEPFSERIIEEFLRKRYETTRGEPKDVPKGKFESWSKGIMDLSGGHPRTIKKLADFLSEPDAANWVADFTTQNQKERRYRDIVEREIEEVLESINDEVAKSDLMKLSVFRIFNLDTIEYLKSIGEFDKSRGAFEIFVPLTRTGLVKRYPNSIFYSDSLIRNLVLLKLKHERREDYLQINRAALDYYDNLIDEAKAKYRKATDLNKNSTLHYFPEYTREAIYHLSEIPELSQVVLEDKLRRYAGNFQEVGLALNNTDSGEQLDRIIGDDAEIVSAIGKDQFETLLNRLFNTAGSVARHAEVPGLRLLPSQKVKVLFLAANPKETTRLQLDEEIRAIKQEIRWAQRLQVIEIVPEEAVRSNEIIRLLNEHAPDIVHFSGHGSPTGELLLVHRSGERPHLVSALTLKKIFGSAKGKVRMVVFNACYSIQVAAILAEVVEVAVGTNKTIGDGPAIAFAAAFYSGLGYGHSVQQAFEQGEAALCLEDPAQENVLGIKSGTGIDPSDVYFIKNNR